MYKKNIYLVEFNQLFLILNEINNFLNYNLIEINDNDFLKKNFNEKNSLFLFKNSKFKMLFLLVISHYSTIIWF